MVYNDGMSAGTVARKQTIRSKKAEPAKRRRGRPRQFDRDEGLRRAMRLFWAQGYEATSMAELRSGLGITQASLYAAYESKEALFREAVDLYLRTDGNTTLRALSRPGRAKDAIRAMLQDAVSAFTSPGAPGGCLIVLGATTCTLENKAVQQHLATLRKTTLEQITQRLGQAQEQGEIGPDISVESLAGYYAMVLHGLSVPSRDGASRQQLTQMVDLAMAAWPKQRKVARVP